jgi:hypothetical protein
MRSALASIVAAGVLAVGAVPATLALAGEGAATGDAGRAGVGPPAWAPAHGHDKAGPRGEDKHAEKRRQQAAWPEDAPGPPPWANAHGKRGRAHAKAMQKWERCVAEAGPAVTCEKPTPPSRTR